MATFQGRARRVHVQAAIQPSTDGSGSPLGHRAECCGSALGVPRRWLWGWEPRHPGFSHFLFCSLTPGPRRPPAPSPSPVQLCCLQGLGAHFLLGTDAVLTVARGDLPGLEGWPGPHGCWTPSSSAPSTFACCRAALLPQSPRGAQVWTGPRLSQCRAGACRHPGTVGQRAPTRPEVVRPGAGRRSVAHPAGHSLAADSACAGLCLSVSGSPQGLPACVVWG